jgi:hypothetical protein
MSVLQQPSLKAPVIGFILQVSKGVPNTLLAMLFFYKGTAKQLFGYF